MTPFFFAPWEVGAASLTQPLTRTWAYIGTATLTGKSADMPPIANDHTQLDAEIRDANLGLITSTARLLAAADRVRHHRDRLIDLIRQRPDVDAAEPTTEATPDVGQDPDRSGCNPHQRGGSWRELATRAG